MGRLKFVLLLSALLAVPGAVLAETLEIAPTGTAASADTGEIPIEGDAVSIQLCGGTGGDVFSGSISVKQGNKTGELVETWSSGAIASAALEYAGIEPVAKDASRVTPDDLLRSPVLTIAKGEI